MDEKVKKEIMRMCKEMEDLEKYPDKPAAYWYNITMGLMGRDENGNKKERIVNA